MPTSEEQRTDEQDWQTFRQLDTLADHWWWRPGWRPDRHYLTWYVVFDDPDLRTYLAGIQNELSALDYLDPVPPDGIHMTVQGVAFADTLTTAQVDTVGAEARRRCADLEPFTLTVGPLAGHPAGTFLRATPWAPVAELRVRLRAAIGTVLGGGQVPDEPARFKPHLSVTYCHAAQPAADLVRHVERLRELPPATTTVTSVDLVELRREHHAYRWDTRHRVHLTASP